MPVTVLCPHLDCGKPVVAPDGARGKPVRCVHCGNLFLVPVTRPAEIARGEGESKPQSSAPAQPPAQKAAK